MILQEEDTQFEGATKLVTREVRRKMAADGDALQQALEIAKRLRCLLKC